MKVTVKASQNLHKEKASNYSNNKVCPCFFKVVPHFNQNEVCPCFIRSPSIIFFAGFHKFYKKSSCIVRTAFELRVKLHANKKWMFALFQFDRFDNFFIWGHTSNYKSSLFHLHLIFIIKFITVTVAFVNQISFVSIMKDCPFFRSEERRVGKEGRSRGSPDH